MKIYLVGGAVRDELLGLPVKERDWVVVGSSVSEMLEKGFQKVGKDFPVFLHPETKEEYALARTERKTGKGYYGFECDSSDSVTLEDDLKRRDLTINAIAKSDNGEIIDPYNGREDLKNKKLKHVSSAFGEDPVRILRTARFAARFSSLGFTVAEETMRLMGSIVNENEIEHLVPERVWQEFNRALQEAKPYVFIRVLKDCGALEKIFPELDKLWDIQENPKNHPEGSTGAHTMISLDVACNLTKKTKIRFAVLCHDLGKILTPIEQLPLHKDHEKNGIKIIKAWCEKYKVPTEYKDFATKFSYWHMHCYEDFHKFNGEIIMNMFHALDLLRDNTMLDDFLIALESDYRGRKGFENAKYPHADFLKQLLNIVKQISAQEFIKKGFSGKQLGEQLYQARVIAINEFCEKHKKSPL